MKKIIMSLLLLASLNTIAQEPNTEIGKWLARSGTTIKKELVNVYASIPRSLTSQYGDIEVKIINLSDGAGKPLASGLSFTNMNGSRTSYLDSDEVQGLLNFIGILNKTDTDKPENYQEYTYTSKDLQFYAFYGGDNNNKTNLYWHYGVRISRHQNRSDSRLELKTFTEMKEAIVKVRGKIK